MEGTPGNWTCFALAGLLAWSPPMSFARAPDPGDARHCLDLGGDLAIARCAEPYRHRRAPPVAVAAPPAREVPAATPVAATPAAATPAATAPASPRPQGPRRKTRSRDADARHCLDLGTLAEIVRCAEKYR